MNVYMCMCVYKYVYIYIYIYTYTYTYTYVYIYIYTYMYIIHVHIHSRRLHYPNEVSGQKDLRYDGVWLAHCGIRRAQILHGVVNGCGI